jgi:hypothetical protein
LFRCKRAECGEHRQISSLHKIKKYPRDLLNEFLSCFIKGWGGIGWICMLNFCTIRLLDVLVQLILRYNRWGYWNRFNAFSTYNGIKRCTFLPALSHLIVSPQYLSPSFSNKQVWYFCTTCIRCWTCSSPMYFPPKSLTMREKAIECHSQR